MSFVTAIRDYVETLNTISEALGQNLTISSFISETLLFILKTLQSGFLYIVSFQWIRDFTLLPIVLPQFSSALFKETFFLETPSKVFFEFLEIPDLHQSKFLLGFFNSFFLSLPLSVVHIISIRRLLIQGIPAAVYSIGGYLIGQFLFLSFIIFGLREILIPWLTLEPFNYVLGLVLIFRIIYSMTTTRETLIELKTWAHPQYKTFFLTSFLLAWCEQTSLFQYVGNLTLSSNVTILETFSSNSPISSFFTHFLYLSGISLGCVLFTGIWGLFFLQVKNWFVFYTPLFTSSFIQLVNKTSFILVLALSLASIPFYGFEYLLTGPLGFVSQDTVFKNTPLNQTFVKDYAKGTTGLSGVESNFQYIDLDLAPFDRGEYLVAPDVQQPLSFEDLNYRGEFDWTTRNAKVSGITDSRSGFFTLSRLFKKQKDISSESENQSLRQDKLEKNRLLSELNPPFLGGDLDTNSETVKRYFQFYDGTRNSEESFQIPYQQLSSSSFPLDYLRKQSQIDRKIEEKIKDKYYSNPVYRSLLSLDIDFFLKRQPDNFKLSGEQEIDLYTKRKILESYYDSLRSYSQLPYSETFESFFDGAKSFSNKVYNQQFKGTLRSVRRLFTIRLDSDGDTRNTQSQKTETEKILKFDQPLYQFTEKQIFSPYHEELSQGLKNLEPGFDQDKYFQSESFGKGTKTDFINTPLYAGWDEQLRKFVITNKFLPRTLAGYKVNIEPEIRGKFDQTLLKQNQKIKFTVWPLSKEKLKIPKTESSIPYITLYGMPTQKATELLGKENFVTLPANLDVWEFQQLAKETGTAQRREQPLLVPKRGGFIWPGNSKLTVSPFLQKM